MLDSMIGVALGQVGASLQDVLTWDCDDFVNAVKYYRLKQREEWERVRWIGYYSVVGMVGSEKVTIDKIKLPIDEPETAEGKKRVKWQKLR
jgi:hypothetical protein